MIKFYPIVRGILPTLTTKEKKEAKVGTIGAVHLYKERTGAKLKAAIAAVKIYLGKDSFKNYPSAADQFATQLDRQVNANIVLDDDLKRTQTKLVHAKVPLDDALDIAREEWKVEKERATTELKDKIDDLDDKNGDLEYTLAQSKRETENLSNCYRVEKELRDEEIMKNQKLSRHIHELLGILDTVRSERI